MFDAFNTAFGVNLTPGSMLAGGLGGLSSFMQGQAQASGYSNSAQGADMTAEEIERKRKAQGFIEAEQIKNTVGTMANRLAVSGVALQGSAMDTLLEAAKQMNLEKLMNARNLKVEAYGQRLAAKQYRKAAKSARRAGMIGAATSLASAFI